METRQGTFASSTFCEGLVSQLHAALGGLAADREYRMPDELAERVEASLSTSLASTPRNIAQPTKELVSRELMEVTMLWVASRHAVPRCCRFLRSGVDITFHIVPC